MNETKPKPTGVRLATLEELVKNILPNFLSPVPSRETLRDWFDQAQIPRLKANPTAKRGGGKVFYSVSAVEKFLRASTMPRRCCLATSSCRYERYSTSPAQACRPPAP
jgi:hypothetical protein